MSSSWTPRPPTAVSVSTSTAAPPSRSPSHTAKPGLRHLRLTNNTLSAATLRIINQRRPVEAARLVQVFDNKDLAQQMRALFLETQVAFGDQSSLSLSSADSILSPELIDLQTLGLSITTNVHTAVSAPHRQQAALMQCFRTFDSHNHTSIQDFSWYLANQSHSLSTGSTSSLLSSMDLRQRAEHIYQLLITLNTTLRRTRVYQSMTPTAIAGAATIASAQQSASSMAQYNDLRNLFSMHYLPIDDELDDYAMAQRQCHANAKRERERRLKLRLPQLTVNGHKPCRQVAVRSPTSSLPARESPSSVATTGNGRGSHGTARSFDVEFDAVMNSLFQSISATKQRLKQHELHEPHPQPQPQPQPQCGSPLTSPRQPPQPLSSLDPQNSESFKFPHLEHPALSPRSPPFKLARP